MYACERAVNFICSNKKNTHILLGVDNTAVVGAVRARCSANHHANELIRRMEEALTSSGCTLEIVPLRSEDNPADAASRNEQLQPALVRQCDEIMEKHCRG